MVLGARLRDGGRGQTPLNSQPSTLNRCGAGGLLREFARKGDAFHDVVMMALPRKEWPLAQRLDRPAASIAAQKALSLQRHNH
jgi:hypothetical protein